LIQTGSAKGFISSVRRLGKPIVLNWGFKTHFLYVVIALQAEGVEAWWLKANRVQARAAFIARGGIDERCFDQQMDDIERDWHSIASVFANQIINAYTRNGKHRRPEELWSDITQRAS
jgi:hypothetical protein